MIMLRVSQVMSQQLRRASVGSLAMQRSGSQVEQAPPLRLAQGAVQGISVVTLEDSSPVSSVGVFVRAGARFETPEAPGSAHFLKSTLLRNIPGDTLVRTMREAELRGNTLHSAVSREHLVLASDFLRDDLVDAVPMLLRQVFNSSFQPYEFLQGAPFVAQEGEAALENPAIQVTEALYQTAFRSTGLGNSLYAKEADVHALSRSALSEFASKHFTADSIAVVGLGVAQKELEGLVQKTLEGLKVPSSGSTTKEATPSKYYGGETRLDGGPEGEAHYVVAYPAPSLFSQDYPASLVLKALLDGNQRVKYGSPSGSACLLSQASTGETSVKAFSTAHSDAGLIGFYIQGSNDEVSSVAPKALGSLKSLASSNSVTPEALSRAKKAAILELEDSQTRQGKLEFLAAQILGGKGQAKTLNEWVAAIEKVQVSDVQKLAKEVLKARPTVVALGNLRKLPFADQL